MLGDAVWFLCCSLASPLCSLRRVMDSGSSCQLGSSIVVRRDLPMVLLCSFGVPLGKSKGFQ